MLYEAKAAAQLNHPNVVAVYEAGVAGGQEFIATEYVDGQTLHDLMSTQELTEDEAIRYLVAICEALGHAHTNRIVHRDVKPGNILVDANGKPLVTDFGLARNVAGRETLSSDGQVLGTALYMAPEQAAGKTRETDYRADLYAVGVIFFEMLTRHLPFRGTVQAVLHQKIEEDPPSPRVLKPKLSKDIETVCLKCLERDPSKRYQTAYELIDELRRILRGEPIKARPVTSIERAWRWCKRRPLISGLAASLVLSLTGGLLGVSYFFLQAEESAATARASLYRAKMFIVSDSTAAGDITAVRDQLDRIAADPGLSPLRDFAWRYFDARSSLLETIGSHGGDVGDLAMSNNGQFVASVGATKGPRDLRVWDVAKQSMVWRLTPDSGRVLSASFSPSKSHLAVGTSDGWVRIYAAASGGSPIVEIKHGPAVRFVEYTNDGTRVLTGGLVGALRIWDVETQQRVHQIATGSLGETLDVRLSPNGQHVGILKDDGFFRVRSLTSLEKVADIRTDGVVGCFTFLGEGESVVVSELSDEPSSRVYRVSDGTVLRRYIHGSQLGDAVCLPRSQTFLATELAGYVSVMDETSLRPLNQVDTHNLSFGRIAISANGRHVAVVGKEGAIRVAPTKTLAQRQIFSHERDVQSVRFLHPDRFVAVASGNGDVLRWDTKSGVQTTLLTDSGIKRGRLAYDLPRGRLAFAGIHDTIRIIDPEQAAVIGTLDVDTSGTAAMHFLANGDLLALMRNGRVVRIPLSDSLSAAAVDVVPKWEQDAIAFSLAVSEELGRLYVGDSTGSVSGFQLDDGVPLDSVELDSVPVNALCFTSGSNGVAFGTDTGLVGMLDPFTLITRWQVKGHVGEVNAIQPIEDESTIVTASRDATIRLWDGQTGEAIAFLPGHERQVFDIDVRRDSRQIISGSLEGDVRLWTAYLDD